MSDLEFRRLYYSTQEVCDITRVRASDLRLWEKKFSDLKPSLSKTGRRQYKPKDLVLIKRIKSYSDEGRSDSEINFLLSNQEAADFIQQKNQQQELVREIIKQVEDILDIMRSDAKPETKTSIFNSDNFEF